MIARLFPLSLLSVLCAAVAVGDEARFTALESVMARAPLGRALGISAEGSVAVGYCHTDAGDRACRWTHAGVELLSGFPDTATFSIAHGVSADGATIVGVCQVSGVQTAFAWQAGTVTLLAQPLPAEAWAVDDAGGLTVGAAAGKSETALSWDLAAKQAGRLLFPGIAYAISHDSRALVGAATVADGTHAVLWRDGKSLDLGALRRSGNSTAYAVNADGSVAVGESESDFGVEAFRWENGRMIGLGGINALHDILSSARGVSADGRVIVGYADRGEGATGAFVWDALHGLRWIDEVLMRLGQVPLKRFQLHEATAISADGLIVVGNGRNAKGESQAWIAHLPAKIFTAAPAAPDANEARALQRIEGGETYADFVAPENIAWDATGRLLVTDRVAGQVVALPPQGREQILLRASAHAGGPRTWAPTALAVDVNGDIYVVDSLSQRISVFSAAGSARGEIPADSALPPWVSVASLTIVGDDLLMADAVGRRIIIADKQGRPRRELGRVGAAEQQLTHPVDVAVARDGRVLVVDDWDQRVVVFGRDGKYQECWGSGGGSAGQLLCPASICVHGEFAYVANRDNHRIDVFSLAGQFVGTLLHPVQRPHAADGRVHFPTAFRVDSGGHMGAVLEPLERRMQIVQLAPGTVEDLEFAAPLVDSEHEFAPQGDLAVCGDLVAVPLRDETVAVFRLTLNGAARLGQVGGCGAEFGRFRGSVRVGWQPSGALLTADGGNGRVQEFQLNEEFRQRTKPGLTGVRFIRARELWLDSAAEMAGWGTVEKLLPLGDETCWVSESGARRVTLLNREFALQNSNSNDARPGTILAATRTGQIRIAVDPQKCTLSVLRSDGSMVRQLGGRGREPGKFLAPAGVAVYESGEMFVTDSVLNRVSSFGADGRLIRVWGRTGSNAGEFNHPAGIACDARGRLIVVDVGNHRCQVFSAGGAPLLAFGAEVYCMPFALEQK